MDKRAAKIRRRDSAVSQGIQLFQPVLAPPASPANHHTPYTTTMRSLSPALASLANVFRIPMSLNPVRPTVSRVCHETLARRPSPQPSPITAAVQQSAPFSSTSALAKRKGGSTVDKRISMFVPSLRLNRWLQSPRTFIMPRGPENLISRHCKTQSSLTIPSSSHSLLPLPPAHSSPSPFLPQSLPAPLDNPPRMATVQGQAARPTRTRIGAPVPGHAVRM